MAEIVELRVAGARLRIAPALGGRVTAAWLEAPGVGPVPVLHPYPEDEQTLLPWPKGGIYPLIPFSGRISQGRLLHEGHVIELAGATPHVLHGISQQRPWTLRAATQSRAVLHYRHEPDRYWPWRFEAGLDVTLEPQRIAIVASLVNLDTRSMPAGLGLHPYVPYQAGDEVRFDAGPAWPFDADYLASPPVQRHEVRTVEVAAARFEAGEVTLFHGGWAGVLRLQRADRRALVFSVDEALSHVVVHRPAGAPYVCIEPVSHVADGFNLHARGAAGTGTRVLAAGVSMRGCCEIALTARQH